MCTHDKYLQSLMSSRLKAKYRDINSPKSQACGLIHQHIIDCIVSPNHFLNPYRIGFEENQINCNDKQFLKRYYYRHQFHIKCSALTQYYKFHQNYPWQKDPAIGIIMMNYQQAMNKQQRKFIKKLMNEPQSITCSENSSNDDPTTRRGNNQKTENAEFSLKLRDLDLNRSSIMLQEICSTINQALNDVKPLYFYRGAYQDGVKQFKRFMNSRIGKRNGNNKQRWLFAKKKHTDENVPKKEKQAQHQNQINKQNESKINKSEALYKSKFDSNKHFRKKFNIVPAEALRRIQKKQSLSRLVRNKTTTIKPQSFSKTTANQTVSREECSDQITKKRNKSSVRIRKCKSVYKTATQLHKTKTVSKLMKISDIEAKPIEKSRKLLKTMRQIRPGSQLKRQDFLSKTKTEATKTELGITFERVLTRQQSKVSLPKEPIKQTGRLEVKRKQTALQCLIKAKLNLRG